MNGDGPGVRLRKGRNRETDPGSAQRLYFGLKKYRQVFVKAMLFPATI
jgi:hypothetical protein